MIVRPAIADELPYLKQRLEESTEELVDLTRSIVHVVEHDGQILGLDAARLIWQREPLMIFPEVKNNMSRRRAALLLTKATENFIADRARNKTGIYSYFFVTKSKAWAALCRKFGCVQVYKKCLTFARDL